MQTKPGSVKPEHKYWDSNHCFVPGIQCCMSRAAFGVCLLWEVNANPSKYGCFFSNPGPTLSGLEIQVQDTGRVQDTASLL